jgi:hypothetical protein
MSTAAPTLNAQGKREIVVISHSPLFYWWPVWTLGYLLCLITFFSGDRLAVVPEGTKAVHDAEIIAGDKSESKRDALVLPAGHKLPVDGKTKSADPRFRMSSNKNLGVLYIFVLLLVIAITNFSLRGLWSVIVIVILTSLAIIFAILGWWERILEQLGFLAIFINLGGYLLISTVLLILWIIVVFYFDRQTYMIFTPGQFRVRLEIGDAESAYDTTGMTLQKQRSDLFRHWILGLGSGDLVVKTAGAQAHHFDMPNVLFLGRKVREIEDLLRSKQVVTAS